MSDLQPLPNEPAARTADGTILDTRDTTPTTTTTSPPTEGKTDAATTAPVTPEPKPAGPPDTYTFKTSSGQELDKDLAASATPIFRELGLTQAQADKLIELQAGWAKSHADGITSAIKQMGAQWEAQMKADPELGPNLSTIGPEIGRGLDRVLTPTERTAFQQAMNETMAGNNPAFVRAVWKLSKAVAPGDHVTGRGPSDQGQTPSGRTQRPSIAEALYPRAS